MKDAVTADSMPIQTDLGKKLEKVFNSIMISLSYKVWVKTLVEG